MGILLGASYFFYLYASVKFLAFILITTVSSWLAALYISKLHHREKLLKNDEKTDARAMKLQKEDDFYQMCSQRIRRRCNWRSG